MSSVTIEAGSTSATTTLGIGTYNVTATASSMISITATKTITQSEVDVGSTEWNLGTMTAGAHKFRVTLPAFTDGMEVGDGVKLTLQRGGSTVEVQEFTIGGSGSDKVWNPKDESDIVTYAEFAVTPVNFAAGDDFILKAEMTNHQPATTTLNAAPSEYTANSYETVAMPLGTEGLTLTIIVSNAYGPTNISIVKQ